VDQQHSLRKRLLVPLGLTKGVIFCALGRYHDDNTSVVCRQVLFSIHSLTQCRLFIRHGGWVIWAGAPPHQRMAERLFRQNCC
jgi:hypothetical protein